MKDSDGNRAVVHVLLPEYNLMGKRAGVVAICAEGVWFTPAQARRFAKQILSCADNLDARKEGK